MLVEKAEASLASLLREYMHLKGSGCHQEAELRGKVRGFKEAFKTARLIKDVRFLERLQRPVWCYSDALAFSALRPVALVVLRPSVFFANGNNSVATKCIALQSGKYFANFRTDTSSPAVVSDGSFDSVKVRANTYVKSLRGNSIGSPLGP